MGDRGTAVLNFGSFPGKSDTSVAVTGQSGIVSGSLVEAWIRPVDSVDHSSDEHRAETLKVMAGDIVAGVGFTIFGMNSGQVSQPNGQGTRLYGQWNVAWVWI